MNMTKKRGWKKNVLVLLRELHSHKCAAVFATPVTETEAPGYSDVIKRPMDLKTIKHRIDTGVTTNTFQFYRDVVLMLTNALMYNAVGHQVHTMAKDMFADCKGRIEEYMDIELVNLIAQGTPGSSQGPSPTASSPRETEEDSTVASPAQSQRQLPSSNSGTRRASSRLADTDETPSTKRRRQE